MRIINMGVWVGEAEELFLWIKDDIKEKYEIENPRFVICRKLIKDKEKIINWMAKWLGPRGRKWVLYKHVEDDIFELKEYFPHPPDTVCFKEINETIEFYKNINKENFFFGREAIVYTIKEAYNEFLFEMRMGESWLLCSGPIKDSNPHKKRVIYNIDYNSDEYGRTIPKGYQLLEKK